MRRVDIEALAKIAETEFSEIVENTTGFSEVWWEVF